MLKVTIWGDQHKPNRFGSCQFKQTICRTLQQTFVDRITVIVGARHRLHWLIVRLINDDLKIPFNCNFDFIISVPYVRRVEMCVTAWCEIVNAPRGIGLRQKTITAPNTDWMFI